jgi:hypothetical protein
MSWYKEIKAQSLKTEVQDIPYGYWIKPDGVEIPVDKYKHYEVALKHGYDKSEALYAGWLRLVTDVKRAGNERDMRGYLDCGCHVKYKPTLNQIIKARKLFENALCGDTVHYDSPLYEGSVKITQLMSCLEKETPLPVNESENWNNYIDSERDKTLNDQSMESKVENSAKPTNITNNQSKVSLPARADRNLARQQARAKNNPLLKQK